MQMGELPSDAVATLLGRSRSSAGGPLRTTFEPLESARRDV